MKNPTPSHPFFSIVTPTLNEEKFYPELLKDLSAQTFKNFEVIHVDGNSEDGTLAVAQSFRQKLNITSYNAKKRNVSYQRNYGMKKAQGEWIIFMDADNGLPRAFLSQLKTQLQDNPQIDVFTCYLDTTKFTPPLKNIILFWNITIEILSRVLPFAPGAMIGIKRDISKKAQFDVDMRMSEDHQFVRDITKLGYKFQVLRRPRYLFSFRRFDKEGTANILSKYTKETVVNLTGGIFIKELPEYPMLGGSYYECDETNVKQKRGAFSLPKFDVILKTATKTQLARIKKIQLSVQKFINTPTKK